MKRTDISHSDVFISWTGKNREMKNQIVAYLKKHNICCTESDHHCAGDFRQWSQEAVSKSTVFLLLYTEDTVNSAFVPLEIEAFKQVEDYQNRCVPVVTDYDLYARMLPEFAACVSAVILEEKKLTQEQLEKILFNVRALICNRLFAIYRRATTPTRLRFASLLKEICVTEDFDHAELYISRSVEDNEGYSIADGAEFCRARDIIYLHAPAGSGKTCYIDQLRKAADEDTLVLVLHCRQLLTSRNLLEEMFLEFFRYGSNHDFFTRENFRSLLSVKHLLLVLDGLDEIGTKEGKEILFSTVRDYYVANADSTTLFITCRNDADADMWKINGQMPRVVALQPLEETQIRGLCENLFRLLGDSRKGDAFYARIRGLAEDIRTNPLLLSQLAIIYNAKGEIPRTVVGIYDAVCEITVDNVKPSSSVPSDFDKNIFRKLSTILKSFSAERYRLLSLGKEKTTEQIFKKILREEDCDPNDAQYLIRFLQDRAILVGNEFYHKMLLEYYTAVYYYEQCFDDYDELNNTALLRELFSHYNDPYWSSVLQLFLVKADSCTDEDTTAVLYRELMRPEMADFTLLFDTCQKLLHYSYTAQEALLTDMLEKSAEGVYPPYGPLFWYVPEYRLYQPLLSALSSLQDKACFTKALALTRDVCWIFGKYNTAAEANSRIDGKALLAKAALQGVRKGLCELFYQGQTDCALGAEVYPRCFNVAEARRWMEDGLGIFGRMEQPFADELALYSHEMLPELGDEWVGIAAMDYSIGSIEERLSAKSCRKLRGLFLSPTDNTKMERLAINSKHIQVAYIPENIQPEQWDRTLCRHLFIDEKGLLYFREKLIVPDCITQIGQSSLSEFSTFTSVIIPSSITKLGVCAFRDCRSLLSVTIPDSVSTIDMFAFSGCSSLTSITIPSSVAIIGRDAFAGCTGLRHIHNCPPFCSKETLGVPDSCIVTYRQIAPWDVIADSESFDTELTDDNRMDLPLSEIPFGESQIAPYAFAERTDLTSITIPDGVTAIGEWCFSGCNALTEIRIPDSMSTIGCAAFYCCSALTSVAIPNGVSTVEAQTFFGCSSLGSVRLPEDATKIGDFAFNCCSSLTSVIIPEQMVEIGWGAFYGCRSLSAIEIPDNVKEIGRNAFYGCSSISSIVIPKSVRFIGDSAFRDCTGLQEITLSRRFEEDLSRIFGGLDLSEVNITWL